MSKEGKKMCVCDFNGELFNTILTIDARCASEVIDQYVKETLAEDEFRITDLIDRVIFNEKAVVVIWTNGNKSIVKVTEGDTYDKEKGLSFAILKGLFDNYYKDIKLLADTPIQKKKVKVKKDEVIESVKAESTADKKVTRKRKTAAKKADSVSETV